MTALVAVETLLLVLLSMLVVGLLRSHAEILRRLGVEEEGSEDRARETREQNGRRLEHVDDTLDLEHLPPPRGVITPAFDIVGQTLDGSAVKIAVEGPANTLIAFLSSGCLSCQVFWEELPAAIGETLPGEARIVVVTKDPKFESPSRLRELAPPGVPVVMSSAAWEAYGISTSPYFVYIDGSTADVRSEGSASGWPQVASLLRDALADYELAEEAQAR